MIKVLLVDDSAIVRAMVSQVMKEDGRFDLVASAENGVKAIEQNRIFNPDLIVMDINMPIMDGIDATKEILSNSSPAVVAYTTEDSASTAFKCLEAGALEVIRKPNLALMSTDEIKKFCDRLIVISEKHKKNGPPIRIKKTTQDKNTSALSNQELIKVKKTETFKFLLVGASTGGPGAIQALLDGLGEDFPLPIIITQHIDAGFDIQFSKWLDSTTKIKVQLAENGTIPQRGNAYIAPADKHLVLQKMSGTEDAFCLLLNDDPPLHFLKPSVDKMFSSAARCCPKEVLAVLLTGMGRDGAEGCLEIKKKGGYTLCQSEKSCVVYGMPRAAIELGAACDVEDLREMASFIKSKIR